MTGNSEGARRRLAEAVRRGGLAYAGLYGARWVIDRVLDGVDRRLVRLEQHRRIAEPWTISARRFTADFNRQLWNGYDWSARGEEWTRNDAWKQAVVDEFLTPYVPEGGTVVEIGPGAGRWTDILRNRARRLYLVDVAETPLKLCRERFSESDNIEYLLTPGHEIAVPAASIDAIWSYDCFVHITPLDIRGYVREFARVLRPGGSAVIHHAGAPDPGAVYRTGARSDMTDKMAVDFAEESGLEVLRQTQRFANPRDLVTVFRKPDQSDTRLAS